MNKILTTALCVLAASSASFLPVAAAPGPPLPIVGSPTGISAGVFVPSSDEAKTGGNTQFDIEFRYGIPLPNPTPLLPVIGLGVETGSRSGSHSTIVPLTAGLLVGLNGISPSAGGSIFAGGGVGAYFINQHRNSGDQLGTRTSIGAFGELGYNVTGLLFLDARYQVVDRGNGLTADIGLRF